MPPLSSDRATVVFLHGMARSHLSLAWLQRQVAAAGYDTWATTYPSRQLPLQDLADLVASRIVEQLPDRPLIAVTHSLGGVLVRHMSGALPWAGAVMLAPPNRGSALAAAVHNNPVYRPFYRWFYGPAGEQVVAGQDPSGWPMPPEPYAVIAGTRSLSPKNAFSLASAALRVFDGPNDGTVAVEETQLPGMCDFATVDATHTWIMFSPEVRDMVLSFLETGRLRRAGAPETS